MIAQTALEEALAHLGAAIMQSVPTDDQIIMDHVKAAHAILQVATRAQRAAAPDLVKALEECVQLLTLSELPAFRDPQYHDEVHALGMRIGFGALMTAASHAWREQLKSDGDPVGGEFVAGPCHASVISVLNEARAALSAASKSEMDHG